MLSDARYVLHAASCYLFVTPALRSCATAGFSMLGWVHALTAGSDELRCAHGASCKLEEYLNPSAHPLRQENRTAVVVAGQWELAIMMFAC